MAKKQNFGSDENDLIRGSDKNDHLFGWSGHDGLIGNAGNDKLVGGEGRDLLFGGSGNDQLEGEEGNDVYLIRRGTGIDHIKGSRPETSSTFATLALRPFNPSLVRPSSQGATWLSISETMTASSSKTRRSVASLPSNSFSPAKSEAHRALRRPI
jgi:Ca2+-binding RTX toxin-like protein